MEEIVKSEHRAIVFKRNRKQAAAVARYIKDHSGSPETIFAVDVDTLELIIQAKNAIEDDIIVLEGEEDVFDVEEETVEETEEVDEARKEAAIAAIYCVTQPLNPCSVRTPSASRSWPATSPSPPPRAPLASPTTPTRPARSRCASS